MPRVEPAVKKEGSTAFEGLVLIIKENIVKVKDYHLEKIVQH